MIDTDHLHPNRQRQEDCADPEDEQDVGNVAADDVPDRDSRVPFHGGLKGHGQFRGGCRERHDRQSDDERRYPQRLGQPAGSANQYVTSAAERGQSGQQHENRADSHRPPSKRLMNGVLTALTLSAGRRATPGGAPGQNRARHGVAGIRPSASQLVKHLTLPSVPNTNVFL